MFSPVFYGDLLPPQGTPWRLNGAPGLGRGRLPFVPAAEVPRGAAVGEGGQTRGMSMGG